MHLISEISTDFDMEFSRQQGRGASIVQMREDTLSAFTVAFWMKVANSEIDPGTPISYAVEVGGSLLYRMLKSQCRLFVGIIPECCMKEKHINHHVKP